MPTESVVGKNVSYAGAQAVSAYGNVEVEWRVLDCAAGLIDSSWRRFFPATGEERREFLHGQTTAQVKSLTAGKGSPALVLSAQGRPLGIFALYETGERIWVATTVAEEMPTREALSRFLVADDCDFEEGIDARCVAIVGPQAAQLLISVGVAEADALGNWGVCAATIGGEPAMVFSRGDLRVPSFDVLACDIEGNASDAHAISAALVKAGAEHCGVDALEIVRIESGTALYGKDVDEQRIAVEARLEWAIHFAKGCYVGQEVIERAVTRGRINHELGLLKVSGDVSGGAKVADGGERDVVTSTAVSPRLGKLALAYLPKTRMEEGAVVSLGSGQETVEAVVLAWPRPRSLPGRA